MKATLKGIIYAVGPVEQIGANNTKKQTLVLLIAGYTDGFGEKIGRDEHWKIDVIGDKVTQLNVTSAFLGRKAECEVYITGKEYEKDGEKSYFYSVNLAKLTLQEAKQTAPAPQQAVQQPLEVSTQQDDTPDWLK